jgi:protein arginine N-methyltransferase 1
LCADLSYNNANHDYYFGSYSHFYIHEEMLKDYVRTEAYRRAIENNPNDFKDKIVLDIGAGTGILSIFAARAGAKHVYAVENAEIAYFAREIIKQNGLEDKITVLKGKMEEIELPVPKVDIIISEWMGYFLLYESMLDSVLWARDKYLNKGGKMLPDKAQIFVASIEDEKFKNNKINFWKNVYGVNMSCLSHAALKEPLIDVCDHYMVNSDTCKIIEFDLLKVKTEDLEFSVQYDVKINRNDKVHAIVAWFDTLFSDLEHPITLSTSPFKEYTHWKQTVFYLD